MKCFTIICVIIALTILNEAREQNEGKQIIKEIAQECKEDGKEFNKYMNQLARHVVPKTGAEKCYYACVMTNLEIINIKTNEFQPDEVIEIAIWIGMDEKEVDIIKEITEDCRELADSNRCVLTDKIWECYKNGIDKRNESFQFGDMKFF